MSPPRKPRGEKPETTIRLLRRYLAEATRQIADLKTALTERQAVIAGYDVQISEHDDEMRRLRSRVADQAGKISDLTKQVRSTSERKAYLEGYHAKSQETVAARSEFAFLSRDRARNARGAAAPETHGESTRHQGGPEGHTGAPRSTFRVQQALSEYAGESRAAQGCDFSASGAASRPADAGSAAETGFDPAQFPDELTPAERLTWTQMKDIHRIGEHMREPDHADDRGTMQPRTPYRGIDGPLL